MSDLTPISHFTPEPSLACAGHAVQFYRSEEYLADVVADFLSAGLAAGEPVVVIATPQHRQSFAERLDVLGDHPSSVTFLDAADTLATFMDGDMPDALRFEQSVGTLVRSKSAAAPAGRIRAYGEMVDLLWRQGKPDAAIRLEELWNGLATLHTFDLLCAYRIGNFFKEAHGEAFDAICRRHHIVIPAEGLPEEREERERAIAALQQRAESLEAEIAHRRELENALREALRERRRAEREVKDFLENASVAMHWVAADGTILWANDEELKLLGYTREEYLGRKITEIHADRHVIDDILRRLSAGEEIRDYEARLRAKDGSIRYVAINSNVLFEEGRFVHTRCFTRDITDRKRLEEERRREERGNAFLLEASGALHSSLDHDALLRAIAALPVPRLAAGCAIEIADEEGTLERIATAGELTGHAMVSKMTAGDRFVGHLTLFDRSPDYDDAVPGEFARTAAAAIENARLYGMVQVANRTKDEFLATLSHELRTPLTAILGWARMINLGTLDEETMRTAVETIERSARTQATIIDDLLDLSRVVTGKLTLQNDLVDLTSIIESAAQTVRLAAEAKGIAIETSVPNDSVVVIGDATRLQQIVWNLLSNAIKFSERGSTVTAALKRDRGHAAITVTDRGHGIAPSFLPHVFEPFRQADGAASRQYGGLGLGLAIVKYLTELHGGTVKADSAGLGKGATFTLTFPMELRSAATAGEHHETMADLHDTAVLLVDDDDDTRQLIAAILRHMGAEVEAVASVDEARLALGRHVPHVLVTDIAMPVHDGFSLLRTMREEGSVLRGVPAIAVTAFGDAGTEQQLRDAGFNAFVRKPIDPTQFVRLVADLRPPRV